MVHNQYIHRVYHIVILLYYHTYMYILYSYYLLACWVRFQSPCWFPLIRIGTAIEQCMQPQAGLFMGKWSKVIYIRTATSYLACSTLLVLMFFSYYELWIWSCIWRYFDLVRYDRKFYNKQNYKCSVLAVYISFLSI